MNFRFDAMISFFILLMGLAGCADQGNDEVSGNFVRLSQSRSGIDFINAIKEDEKRNYLNYYYFYNGSGVGIGDINNDDLPDIYFGANQGENKLYLNLGNLRFKDITREAGVANPGSWTSGISMADINNDGHLDIYVCNSGPEPDIEKRRNRLFINNGDLTFSDRAREYGLDLPTFSTQAYFFDFDKDQDLDIYLVNHRVDWQNNNKLSRIEDSNYERETSDYLLRNDGESGFTNYTEQAGILNKAWGLSAAIGDFNNDGWDDVYVANDFVQGDYLYINNKNGTFTNRITDYLAHTTNYSMGSDFGDIDNDGLPDLVVSDMVPEGHVRSKMLMFSMNTDNFQNLIDYYQQHQYMSNMLHINNGNGLFSEIGQFAGINKTDWSWATLLADFDNDGFKDLFITNGIKRDITDNDYTMAMLQKAEQMGSQLPYNDILEGMPGTKLPNYVFRNKGNYQFDKKAEDWGLSDPFNSNGAAYADLDNDGDLDLVINNLDDPSTLFENRLTNNSYIKIKLIGPPLNPLGIGAKLSVTSSSGEYVHYNYLARGYLSSVSEIVHFGLGKDELVHSVKVEWPDGKISISESIEPGKTIRVDYSNAGAPESVVKPPPIFVPVDPHSLGIYFTHRENSFDDFKGGVLLPHVQSQNGPYIAVGDINGDLLDDFFIGGAAGQSGHLFVQSQEGIFHLSESGAFEAQKEREDMKCLFLDYDQDGDQDLYVVSGGVEFPEGDDRYSDRLYTNDGSGNFVLSENILPDFPTSSLAVASGDIDRDGDPDLFIGGRNIPGKYPLPASSYFLRNDAGRFTDVTKEVLESDPRIGLVNDAVFNDLDGDGWLDLVVCGEWMPVAIYLQKNGVFVNQTDSLKLDKSNGWWFSLAVTDINGDGLPDILGGNIGGNNKFQPRVEDPLHVFAGDMDDSGTFDVVLSHLYLGDLVPTRGRSCSSEQMPVILEKFTSYKAFAQADIREIYGTSEIDSASHYMGFHFENSVLVQNDEGQFEINTLPGRAQFAPIRSFLVDDFNGDQIKDILGVGNVYGTEVETIRYDGPNAVFLDGAKEYQPLLPREHGFFTQGDTRDIQTIIIGGERFFLVSRNDAGLLIYRLNEEMNPDF